ncbi:Vacuolar calcium ion transporter [Recurvomyces mirabilis]|uniref:Vacuolar calcium ion transporter n=1 Tax=Recurvomyces mirabilis TaxID=574656 RepID=A0AAE0WX10_9PEZI|nr:Vacuolar calcium ion transporter [Recurvomyces mirabilis]KAK5162023.1 hypothetical protein LTS14_000369 [Recurvomyces mirabilis]
MHSIKKVARRQAWYAEDTVYNPFGRYNSHRQRRRSDSLENNRPLVVVHTENDAEIRPIASSWDPSPGPRRADTYPAPLETRRWSAGPIDLPATELAAPDNANAAQSTTTTTKLENDEQSQDLDSGPRRRKARKFLPWKQSGNAAGSEQEVLVSKQIPFGRQLGLIFLGSWTMILWCFVPAGFAVYYTHQDPIIIFIINFLAIIPTNEVLAYGVEQLGMHFGDRLEGLLSMTFRNIIVLQASLLGGILQNLLLMTGVAFVVGGYHRKEQYFSIRLAQTISMFLLLAVLSLTIPTVSRLWGHSTPAGILAQSRGTAVVIMTSYVLWLVFQLKTNRSLFDLPDEVAKASKPWEGRSLSREAGAALKAVAAQGAMGASMAGGTIVRENLIHDQPEEKAIPKLSWPVAIVAIVATTVLLALNTEFATNSIQAMSARGLPQTFLGLVILPLMSNDPAIITVAKNDKMDMALVLTLERAMQTALMVVPLIVLIAWGMRIDEMTLDFDGFAVASLFASIIIVTYVVQEGRTNWLTGALLLKVFIIISLASFYITETLQT